jgi:hypothetical protein
MWAHRTSRAAIPLVFAFMARASAGADLSKELLAEGPDPRLRDKLALFGRLVGDWSVEARNHLPDGSTQRVGGSWHARWILDGRAVQTVWTVPDCAQQPTGARMIGCGITIAFYEPESDAWRGVSASVSRPAFTFFTTRRQGDEIVLADEASQRRRRWILSGITARSFRFRALESDDGGTTWDLQQEIVGTRSDTEAPPSSWLLAHAPASPSKGESLFGQLVGDWAIDCEAFRPDGALTRTEGEIHLGWILDGLAIQDVWERKGTRLGGTTLRLYDRELRAWRSVFVHPSAGFIGAFLAREEGPEIVLEKTTPDGPPERWIFSNVGPASFDWRSIESHDGKATWATTEHYRARRV